MGYFYFAILSKRDKMTKIAYETANNL